MPPAAGRGRKRKSDQSTTSETHDAPEMAGERIPTKSGNPVRTPTRGSPVKRRKIGISLAQKQSLIDNLQLEVTERARKLRAQYNLQAQGLRTRIEIRVNRIPMALRRAKMGDLVNKHAGGASHKFSASQRPPPVPEKDVRPKTAASYTSTAPAPVSRGPGRPPKRTSEELAGGNKENLDVNSPKKRMRASPAPDLRHNPSQVLSPTSSNTRIIPRKRGDLEAAAPAPAPASPEKSQLARPPSPVKKTSGSNMISNMVEKARATRGAATRKATTSSTASSSSAAARTTRRGAATATTAAAAARATAASRTARRVSGISESSDGSTSTVVRKRVGAAPARVATASAVPKRTVMGTIKKGVAGATTRKAPATKVAAPTSTASTGTGRVLRKRA